ncbi:MAG: hypothetical protein GY752_01050 [bacterium]|nr:hypothetical protein [bacterium]MCP4800214.1 hypothetical protein [bacterium]
MLGTSWNKYALVVVVLSFLLLSSCTDDGRDSNSQYGVVYGDSYLDNSDVVCKVGNLEITRKQMDMRYEELPVKLQKRFSGEGWQRRFINYMVEEALLVTRCVDEKIINDPLVQRNLISQRRYLLAEGYKNVKLFDDLTIDEQLLRDYYKANKDQFVNMGAMNVRHIECLDESSANLAWDKLHETGRKSKFPYVCAKFSVNKKSVVNAGDLGWFNKGGYIPLVEDGKNFSNFIWGWDVGLHEPVKIGNKWHIIEVLRVQSDQQQTFAEARDKIIVDLTPMTQENIMREFLETAKAETEISFYHELEIGDGRSAEDLFRAGMAAAEPEVRIDYFDLILQDYPEDPYAAKSLFMIANLQIDRWGDLVSARAFLNKLINQYPDSEMVDQAQYMLDNLNRQEFRTPTSIEELRK